MKVRVFLLMPHPSKISINVHIQLVIMTRLKDKAFGLGSKERDNDQFALLHEVVNNNVIFSKNKTVICVDNLQTVMTKVETWVNFGLCKSLRV
jgi:hypothetical protein